MVVSAVAVMALCGCGNDQSETNGKHYDGKALMEQKCVQCHNLQMPPDTNDQEKAPPMYAIAVHLKEWMKGNTDSEKKANFITFVQSYVLHPSRNRSYCKKDMLQKYGLMPSQEGKVSKEELKAIAAYAADTYDQNKMLEILKEKNRIAAMKPYQQVLALKDCKMCHIQGAGKVAPLFKQIAAKYAQKDMGTIKDAILHGSKGKWPAYHAPMRAYPDLTPKQLDGIAQWILDQR